MTPTAGKDSHPEVGEIADLSESLLPPARAAEVRRHLDGCAVCADVLASLEEIHGLLGTLPGPQRMPDDVAGRIDAALAAEALLDSTRPDVPRETSPSGSRDVPRGTSTAPPGGHAGGSTGPGRGDRPGSRPGGRQRRRLLLAVTSVASALVLGGLVYAIGPNDATSGSDSGVAAKRDGSATSAGGASVAGQVRRLLAGPMTTTSAPTMAPNHVDTPKLDHGSAPATGSGPTDVPSCVLKATHRTQPVLAAEQEPFNGNEAYLLVLPHPGNATLVDAFVVNALCTAASPGAVLFQGTYPR